MNVRTNPSVGKALRHNLLVGLLTVAPLVVTAWILVTVIGWLDRTIYALSPWNFYVPGLGAVVAFGMVLLTGFVAKTYFGRFMNNTLDNFMAHVPFVRGLYSGMKQVSSAFFSEHAGSNFSRVVYAPFPAPPARAIAFISGKVSETESYVFVPTAPNPTSGYVLVYRNDQLEDSGLEVDEAFGLIVSCGIVGHKPADKKGV